MVALAVGVTIARARHFTCGRETRRWFATTGDRGQAVDVGYAWRRQTVAFAAGAGAGAWRSWRRRWPTDDATRRVAIAAGRAAVAQQAEQPVAVTAGSRSGQWTAGDGGVAWTHALSIARLSAVSTNYFFLAYKVDV